MFCIANRSSFDERAGDSLNGLTCLTCGSMLNHLMNRWCLRYYCFEYLAYGIH